MTQKVNMGSSPGTEAMRLLERTSDNAVGPGLSECYHCREVTTMMLNRALIYFTAPREG